MELRDSEKVWTLCGTDVLNCGDLCGAEGYCFRIIHETISMFFILQLIYEFYTHSYYVGFSKGSLF